MRKGTPEFLLIDVGNTRLKWATARARGSIRLAGEIDTKQVSASWIAALARQFSKHRLVLASVVPKLVPPFRHAFAGRIEVVRGGSPALGLVFDYPKPSEIGADRLACAVAAHAAGRWPAIVVACGTATAFTVLDARGRLCGGAIAPGPQAQLDVLSGATAQLPAITLRPPRHALGRSTRDAIRAGVMLQFRGGVNEIVRELSRALPGHRSPRVILTGGHARLLKGHLDFPFELRPLLVLEGLRMIGQRSFSEKP